MLDPQEAATALADLRALLPMVRHHVAMLSSPATAGQNANAGAELADLAGAMGALCVECGIDDCAQLLDALNTMLRTTPSVAGWSPQFASATLEAFGYVQHRISTLESERSSSGGGGQHAAAVRLTQALADAYQPASGASVGVPAAARDVEGVAALFGNDEIPFSDPVPAEPVQLTDEERSLLHTFRGASLRVTQPPASRIRAEALAAESLTAPLRPSVAGSGWAPGPVDVLPDALAGAPGLKHTGTEQVVWHAPTAHELDEIPDEMKRLFLVETVEDIRDLQRALLKYEQQPDDPGVLHAIGRITHKIKGTAATLGFDVLATITHHYEELIKALLTQQAAPGERTTSALMKGLVLLQSALDASNAGQEPDPALAGKARTLVTELVSASDTVDAARDTATLPRVAAFSPPGADPSTTREVAPSRTHGIEGESLLRVDVHRLDELMRNISALAVNRAMLSQTRDDVNRLKAEMDQALARLNDLGTQMTDLQPALRQPPDVLSGGLERYGAHGTDARGSGLPQRAERAGAAGSGSPFSSAGRSSPLWDELELDHKAQLDSALRALHEVVADISTSSRQLRAELLRLSQVSEDQETLASRMQHAVMHIRLVPLSSLVPRLDFEVRLLAPLVGKAVTFSITGEMTEIDRDISEALAEPLLQLVRNAIVHGIETPDERVESNKPPEGTIWVHAYYMGSEVIVEVGDDGRGSNPHKLAASAVAADLIAGDVARTLSPTEALDLMFMPGVTTFEKAQPVSGRGIGLDEVRTAIERLKGSISVRSEPGNGTVFRVRVPISLSIVHALRVLAGGQSYAIPFSSVQRTLSLNTSELLTSAPLSTADDPSSSSAKPVQRIRIEREHGSTIVGDATASQTFDEVPVFALATLLGLEHEGHNPQPALLVEIGRQRVALLVDGVYEEQEVVVQTLPRHLQRHAVRGASVTPDGQLLLLLDLPELAAGALDGSRAIPAPRRLPPPRAAQTLAPRVLVVDDSVSIRRTLEHILQRGGFEVRLARDGIEALEMMLTDPPRVVVLDIEMPRLDGFELLSIVRGSPQFADVRVTMLTSRAADKHKEHALKLGAQAYLIKPCPPETLIETVRGLLVEPVAVPQ